MEQTNKQPKETKNDAPIRATELVCPLCSQSSQEIVGIVGEDRRTLLIRCTVCHKVSTFLLAEPIKVMKPLEPPKERSAGWVG